MLPPFPASSDAVDMYYVEAKGILKALQVVIRPHTD